MAPNVRVGKYILKKKIGEGAFAEVRHAIHEETKQEYAVKVFERAKLPDGDFERDIKKEVKIMQHLRHPNIVSIHAVLVTTSKMYLVMELVRGGELYDEIVSRRRIDEDTSRKYFQQLIDAMIYCHRRGVVHRDLKPENLLLDEKGNLKVTDFGMSWMSDNATSEEREKQLLRTQCGTPKYMAPEIIVRPTKGYDGEKLDAWECGMVLFALLAGYLPFSGEDDDAVFRSILKGAVKFPSFFSAGAKSLLLTLLEKNPEKRSTLEQVRQHPWFQVNYFGDASIVPLASSKASPETRSKDCMAAMSTDSQDQRYHDARGDSQNENQLPVTMPPTTSKPTKAQRAAAAAHRKEVMRLNLKDIEDDDPFDSNLQEIEVPATPTPRVFNETNSTPPPPARHVPKDPASAVTPVTSPPTPPPPTPSANSGVEEASGLRQLGSFWSPRIGNVFAMSKIGSFGGPPSTSRPEEHRDSNGPASIRERISGSPFGTMYRSLRDGLVPKGASNGRETWSQEDSPSSVITPVSVSPMLPPSKDPGLHNCGNEGPPSRVPKRKLKKGFQFKA